MDRQANIGLCSNCIHNATCVFARDSKRSLMYCEEYQVEASAPAHLCQQDCSSVSTTGVAYPKEICPLPLDQGLCCDCEGRKNCGLASQPEGGVWYCEEYR